MTEVRRVAWPDFEATEWDKMNFLQGIAGTLELFHRSSLSFQQIVGEATGHPVAVFQRIDQAGYKLPIDERVLADTDTLLVFGLDHLVAEQEAEPAEIEAIREWLKRDGTCLLLAPHHDVGCGLPNAETKTTVLVWLAGIVRFSVFWLEPLKPPTGHTTVVLAVETRRQTNGIWHYLRTLTHRANWRWGCHLRRDRDESWPHPVAAMI